VYVFDVPTGEALTVLKVAKNAGLRGPVFSPDSRRLAVAAQEVPEEFKQEPDVNPADMPQPRVFLVDLAAGGESETIVCPHGTVGDLAFSPDGKLIALGAYGCVWLFDATHAQTGK
jgi:Tol biopolymer transport system component